MCRGIKRAASVRLKSLSGRMEGSSCFSACVLCTHPVGLEWGTCPPLPTPPPPVITQTGMPAAPAAAPCRPGSPPWCCGGTWPRCRIFPRPPPPPGHAGPCTGPGGAGQAGRKGEAGWGENHSVSGLPLLPPSPVPSALGSLPVLLGEPCPGKTLLDPSL